MSFSASPQFQNFPADLIGGGGIAVDKQGLTARLSLGLDGVAPLPSGSSGSLFAVDPTGAVRSLPLAGIARLDDTGILGGVTGMNIAGTAGTTLFVRPSINGADGTTFYSASSDFGTPKGLELLGSRILLTPSDRVQILPTQGTMAMALDVVQKGPTGGTQAGPQYLNKFDITWSSALSGAGSPGLPGSATFGAFQVSLNAGGPNFDGTQTFALSGGLTLDRATTSHSDLVGISGGVHATAPTNGLLDGVCSGVYVGNGGSSPQIAGYEADMTIIGTGTAPLRFGYVAVNQGTKTATGSDMAFAVSSTGPEVSSGGAWKTVIGLNRPTPYGSTNSPAVQPTANFFLSDHPVQFANIFSAQNVTVTNNIFDFQGFIVTGSGVMTAAGAKYYAPAPATTAGQVAFGNFVGAASLASGTVAGALGVNINGTVRYIPFY